MSWLATVPARAADEPPTSFETTVVGTRPGDLATPSVSQARKRLERIPGGTSLITAGQYRQSAVRNLRDVLAFVPGVFVQSRFGGAETRTSIRGSGISQTYGVRGIRFLRDGLPLNAADGYFSPELIEPLTARYVEVYRGANALRYGAATLGGAVNFVSETGYTAPPLRLRLGAGSDGYLRPQVSVGRVFDNGVDFFGSLSGLRQHGFRDQSREHAWQGYANIGLRHDADTKSRLHVNVRHSRLELPGSLTKAQVAEDPAQANPQYIAADAFRNIDVARVAFQQTVLSGNHNRLDAGVFYQHSRLHHPLPFFVLDSSENDAGLSVRQAWYNRANRLIAGGRLVRSNNDYRRFIPLGGARSGALKLAGVQKALTADVFVEDQWHLAGGLAATAGAQAAYTTRRSNVRFGAAPDADAHYTGFSPKLGLSWQATQTIQVFGNLSRSFEPPTFLQLQSPGVGVLDAQTATTIEVGARDLDGRFGWSASIYHSRLNNEILTTETPPGSGNFITNNADRTLHSGVELGLQERLPLNWFGNDALRMRAAYTYSYFVFDNDPAFGDNRIPGIPGQFARLELLYEAAGGFYIGPTVEAANAYFVDYANTLKTDAYVVFGARGGYRHNGLSVFVEAHNLADRHYVSNTSIIADAHGEDAAVFNPGAGRSIYAGVEVNW